MILLNKSMEKKNHVGCIIQARMGSSILPGKVLEKIFGDKTVLDCLIDQLSHSKLITNIVVATSENKLDDPIEKLAQKKGTNCFRGSELDVLDRYYQCARINSFPIIVRIPADKPLIDPFFVDKIIEEFLKNDLDYISTFNPPSFPRGSEVEVFNFDSLENAWKNASLPSEREHVTPYLYTSEKFRITNYSNEEDISDVRYAVDRYEDLVLVKKIFGKIKKNPILMKDILTLFKDEPSLLEINKNVDHDEGYKKSLNEDKKYI